MGLPKEVGRQKKKVNTKETFSQPQEMEEKRFVHLRNGKIYSTTGVGRESAADAATPPTDHHLKTDLVLDTASGRIVDVWSTDDSQQQPTSVALPPADDTRVIDLEGKLVLPVRFLFSAFTSSASAGWC
jgi:hypothetical protein